MARDSPPGIEPISVMVNRYEKTYAGATGKGKFSVVGLLWGC